uniref:Max-binding protein MNT n=1 Tax=Macrostomum lignano TaxID=282301 RepID=A0A1I8HP21_9PLAT
ILEFRRRELETRAASKIRNDLEAAVIEYRARLFGDDSSGNHDNQMKNSSTVQPIYSRCSSKKERQELLAALAKAEQALAAGSSSNLTMLNTELKRLKQTFAAVSARAIELMKRPAALASLESVLKLAESNISATEKDSKLIAETRSVKKWLTAAKAALVNADLTQNPPVLRSKVSKRRLSHELEDSDEDDTLSESTRPRRSLPSEDEVEASDESDSDHPDLDDDDDIDRGNRRDVDFHSLIGEL